MSLNPLVHQARRLGSNASSWVQQFSVEGFKVLIICRGPIRKEVMDTLSEMGAEYGILLSEKDSVAYKNALAPELRQIARHDRVHRVPDYTGVDKLNGMPASSRSSTSQRVTATTAFLPAMASWPKTKPWSVRSKPRGLISLDPAHAPCAKPA